MRFSTERILSFRELKREYIRWVYKIAKGNKSETARLLGMDRRSVYRVLEKYLPKPVEAENDTDEATQPSIAIPYSDPPLTSTDDPRIREVCDVTRAGPEPEAAASEPTIPESED